MEAVNKDSILKEIPLFAGLPQEECELIKERSTIAEFKKHQVIYNEGSPGEAFYCIIFGRVVIYDRDQEGKDSVLEYLHRGKYFGIISLLTNGPHSVSAKAINDSSLLVIKKEDFDFILKRIPALAIDLSQTLSRRLKNKSIHQKTVFESTIISVFSSYSKAGKTIYALNLALSLRKETRKPVILLDICADDFIHSQPQKFEISQHCNVLDLSFVGPDSPGIIKDFIAKSNLEVDLACISYKAQDVSCAKKLLGFLSFLINDYYYIILDLPSLMDQFVFSILNQSDLVHILTGSQAIDLKKTHHLIERFKKDLHFQESKFKLIINEYKLSKISHQEEQDLLGYNIYATLPKIELGSPDKLVLEDPESEYAKVIKRVSRQLGDMLVGLALGVGAGYGFCHIGVLNVIEEENIPIDIIAGSSIGALIASLWAIGKSAQEILAITREEFKQPKYTWSLIDLTFPLFGFMKGKKLYKFLKKYLGNKTFYDTRLPLKIVASDIKKREPRILDRGLLVDAVMASCAMPGIFMPFRLKEEMLLDGGIINPLPTEALFKIGIKKIIAVNVTPLKEDMLRQIEEIKKDIDVTRKEIKRGKWLGLKQYWQDKFKTNILNIIFSSIEVMQSEVIQKESQLADIVLHPDTTGLHWLELYRAQEFFKRGQDEARRNLDKIWDIVKESR